MFISGCCTLCGGLGGVGTGAWVWVSKRLESVLASPLDNLVEVVPDMVVLGEVSVPDKPPAELPARGNREVLQGPLDDPL